MFGVAGSAVEEAVMVAGFMEAPAVALAAEAEEWLRGRQEAECQRDQAGVVAEDFIPTRQ
jgi:hypothetical protein